MKIDSKKTQQIRIIMRQSLERGEIHQDNGGLFCAGVQQFDSEGLQIVSVPP